MSEPQSTQNAAAPEMHRREGFKGSEIAEEDPVVWMPLPNSHAGAVAGMIEAMEGSEDAGESEMDQSWAPDVSVRSIEPELTGFVSWEREGKPRGFADWVMIAYIPHPLDP